MNRTEYSIFTLQYVAVIFTLCFLVYTSPKVEDASGQQAQMPTTINPEKAIPMGIGTAEDKYARFNWEKSRLVDPATGELPPNIRQRELAFAATLPKHRQSNKTGGVTWEKRGPFNVGGRSRAFAIDATDENTFLIGGVTGGMWRTTDGGQTYVKTTTPDQFHSVTSVAQDTRTGKTDTWYYGTGEYYGVISTASFSNQASGNGIYKSTDGGQSWSVLPSTVSNTPTTLYQKSDFDFVWKIVTDPTNTQDDVVFAAVVNGIFRSKDGGTTWEAVLGLDTAVGGISRYTTLEISPTGILYAGLSSDGNSGGGVYRSADGGDTWTEITPAGFPGSFRRVVLALEPDETKMYVLTNSPFSGTKNHNLWHYTYLGGDGSGSNGTWQNRSSNIPVGNCTGYFDFEFESYSSQSSYDMCMVVKPDNPNVVILGGTNVYRSTDGFTSDTNWSWIGGYQCDTADPANYVYPNHHPDQHLFAFLPSNPDVLFTANDGGIYKTNDIMKDSVEYVDLNNGYVTTQFYTLAIEEGAVDNDIVIGGKQDNGTTYTNNRNETQPWTKIFVGDGSFCGISEGREYYYLSIQNGRVYKCEVSDQGETTSFSRIDPTGGSSYQFINPFVLNPSNTNEMFLAGGRYVWRNSALDSIPITFNVFNTISDGWERINQSLLQGNFQDQPYISAVSISAENDSFMFYGTTKGFVYRLDSLKNRNYEKVLMVNPDFPPFGAYVSSIVQNEQNADELIITYSNYETLSMFYSNDRGNTWTEIGGNLEENPDGTGNGPSVIWSGILPLGDSTVYYAGTSIGLFSTTTLDSSNTVWTMEAPNEIGNVIINAIKTRAHDGLVVVGTHGNGVYSARYKELPADVTAPVLSFNLLQNAPNPFSTQTYIAYTILQKERVVLTVYSMDGREVKQLVNEEQIPGDYSVSWNGRDNAGNLLPSGTYIYEIKVGSQSTANKLVITR